MALRTKLTFFIAAIALTFIAAISALQWMQSIETEESLIELREERRQTLEAIVETTHRALYQLAYDYSYWGEMVDFATKPSLDLEWAKVNVDEPLKHFTADFAWVLRVDQSEVYRGEETPAPLAEFIGIDQATLGKILSEQKFPSFFANTSKGLVKFQGAPLQPSNDAERASPAQGWYFVARLWDEKVAQELSRLAGGAAHICHSGHTHGERISHFSAEAKLLSWNGTEISCLVVDYNSALITKTDHFDKLEILLLIVLSVVVVVFATLLLRHWILRPLQAITHSLNTGDIREIKSLTTDPTEIGLLARLARSSMDQQQRLLESISQREKVEFALKRSIEERERLGRDLHDGIIQRIYATGLSLEASHVELLRTAPAQAQRVHASIQLLNTAISDLRQFIMRTTQDDSLSIGLADGLREIAASAKGLTITSVECEIDEFVCQKLPADTHGQLLLIAREAASNALRHSEATHLAVTLTRNQNAAVLTIHDNGCGFQPEEKISQGHGLDNMVRRAEEFGASIDLESTPGKGCKISVEIPFRDTVKSD